MKFIDNPRKVLGHYTTVALGTASSLLGTWMALPEPVKASMQPHAEPFVMGLATVVVVLGFIGKFIDQTGKEPS